MSKYKHHKSKGFLARMSYVSFQGYYPGVMLTMRKSDVGRITDEWTGRCDSGPFVIATAITR